MFIKSDNICIILLYVRYRDIANEILKTKILNSMVKQIIFRNILRINRTLNDHLSTHGSSVYNLYQIHKILLGLEAADELGVVWRSDKENKHQYSKFLQTPLFSLKNKSAHKLAFTHP